MKIKIQRSKSSQRGRFIGFKDAVINSVEQLLPVIRDESLVRDFARFEQKLIVNIKNTKNSFGGIDKKGNPTITIARNDQFWNKNAYLNKILRGGGMNLRYPSSERYIYAQQGKWLAAFHNDPVIGGFVSNSRERHVLCVVAHELAHAADYFDGDESAHGGAWRFRYSRLRQSKHLKRWESL